MRKVIARGRHMGKSIANLEYAMLQEQAKQMSANIDKMIIDEIWALDKYRVRKSEHSQYGINNPDWWKFQDSINITDKLLTLLVLRFAE